jgi:cell wall-associated NlpC family hydrolase
MSARHVRLMASFGLGLAVVVAGSLTLEAAAGATTAPRASTGHVDHSAAVRGGRLAVSGWALDPTAPTRSIPVDVYVDGKRVGRYATTRPRADINRKFATHGIHGFAVTITLPRGASVVRVHAIGRTPALLGGSVHLNGTSAAGSRIIAQARKYLGVPYVNDGASPSGFDCSGYVMWVYRHASVAGLPHNAEAQRHKVRIISRHAARPGDLIFYLSGGYAYHVAIYAGNGRQYAAPAPGQPVKLENIWSSAIQFGTDWH